MHAYGAGGGTGLASDKNKRSRGGAGGYATAKVEVQPGDTFRIIVGQGAYTHETNLFNCATLDCTPRRPSI